MQHYGSRFRRRNRSSGSRSSTEPSEVSQISGVVSGSPATGWNPVKAPATGRNPVKALALAIRSCFFRPKKGPRFSEEERVSTAMPSFSSLGSSQGSEMRLSGRGIYGIQYNPSRREPGGTSFTMADIRKATRNFSPSLKIGHGGFGTVYKGKLDDNTIVAVKRAKQSVHNNHLSIEFKSETQILAHVEHLNLVRFLGYLEQEDERIIVVEYVPNGNLREHLDCFHEKVLDLAARLDIAIDVAHAVTYLHMYTDHPIIHRDIKSSNILLTENLRAKVADFGFARLGATESDATHVSTQVKGTVGYLDPEYVKTYQLTEKSDVFSFGVLLVELITGRRPIEPKRELNERITTRWAMKKFAEGNAIQTLDPNLTWGPATNLALEKILELALQCLAPIRRCRPSMRRCAEILWSIRKDYKELSSSYQRNPSVSSSIVEMT